MSLGAQGSREGESGSRGKEHFPGACFLSVHPELWFKGSCILSEVSLIPDPWTLSARSHGCTLFTLTADLWPKGQTHTSKAMLAPASSPEGPPAATPKPGRGHRHLALPKPHASYPQASCKKISQPSNERLLCAGPSWSAVSPLVIVTASEGCSESTTNRWLKTERCCLTVLGARSPKSRCEVRAGPCSL